MKLLLRYSTILFLLWGLTAQAQVSEDDLLDMSLDELLTLKVVGTSKVVDDLDKAPGSILIIDKEQIEDLNARNLRDVLQVYVPGMDVVPTYFLTGNMVNEGVYARGILSDFNQQVLILINGKSKYNETTFGSPSTAMQITMENVERVEINNSPEPTLGSGALTTINIVTKEREAAGSEWWANSGINTDEGFQSARVSGIMSKRISDWKVGASMQIYRDAGQLHPDSEQFGFTGDDNELRNGTRLSSNLSLTAKSPDGRLEIGTWYKNVSRDALFSNLNISPNNDIFKAQNRSVINQLSYDLGHNYELTAGYSNFRTENTFNLDEFLPFGVNERQLIPFKVKLFNYNAFVQLGKLFDVQLAGKHKVYVAARVEREGQNDHRLLELNEQNQFIDVTRLRAEQFNTSLGNFDRSVFSVFAEDNWTISNTLSLLAGLRFDGFDNFGTEISTLNPRAALVYNPSEYWVIKALYTQAVRTPSIYETHGSRFLPNLYGNTSIDNERLVNYEFQVIYRREKLRVQLNAFYQVLQDQINYLQSPLDTTIFVASNEGETEVSGVEIQINYEWTEGNYVFINAAQLNSENTVSESQTPFIPETYINGGINLRKDKWNVNLNASYRGERVLPAQNTSASGDAQLLVNASLTYKPNRTWRFYVQGSNLFNADHRVPLKREGLSIPVQLQIINIGTRIKL